MGKHVFHESCIDNKYWSSGGEHLQRALEKYGGKKEFFEYSILDWVECSKSQTEEILGQFLMNLEKYYIDLLGTFTNPEDYNETPGGDGWERGENNPMYQNHRFSGKNHPMYGKFGSQNPRTGQKHSESSKEKMRKPRPSISGKNNPMYGVRLCGPDNPFYGRTHSEKTKRLIGEANKGRGNLRMGKNNPMYGRTLDKSPRSVSVVQLDLNNNFIRQYASFSEAVEEGFKSSCISACCRKRTKTHKGYRWMYKRDYDNLGRR